VTADPSGGPVDVLRPLSRRSFAATVTTAQAGMYGFGAQVLHKIIIVPAKI
jgi:hypothetical protein